ncbi:MAG: hypothetical protein OXK80_04015 [Bdellovibrionales bacterium]|nr:hypothetical protein [Bdellovibrionales bacterium]
MEKIWITRIKGHILGPFSTDEILEMIESNKLSTKDEINKALKQWVYVKNASELYDFSSQTKTDVPIIKKRRDSKKNWMEDTVILDSPLQLGETETEETKTVEVIEQKNSEPHLKELDLENAEVVDYKVDELEDIPKEPKESSAQFETIDQVKQKASIKSQKAVKHVWAWIWIISAGALLFYFSQYTKSPSLLTSDLSHGRQLFNQGAYKEALNIFKKSTIENDSDRLKLASMLVQLEGDTYQAQINIEKITGLSPIEQARLEILRGIIAHKNNDLETAETLFNQALAHAPFLGTLHKVMLNINNHEKALDIINQTDLTHESIDRNKNILLLLKSYLELSNTEDDSPLKEILISNQGDYKQEAFLLLLYRQVFADAEEYSTTVKQVLDQDPYITKEYKSDILSYTPLFIWKELLLDVCSSITAKVDSKSHFVALQSLCLTQAGLSIDALRNIEKARAQSPRDPLISSVYVFISSQNNLDEHTMLDHSLKQNQDYVLPFILKARFCQSQEDVYCTHNNWNQVRQKHQLSLSAIAGEAWSYSKMGKNEEAQDLIQTGLVISNRYKPLLQLKDSL